MSPPPDGDKDRGHGLLIVGSIFATISTVTVLSRVFARALVVKNIGLDDLFMILGAVGVRFPVRFHLRLTDFGCNRSS